ncbi:MAG: hypothetical protein OQJ89_09300 [Kangiellaceae bacterium]|nr:hypothetical protein [Kangiellaceae bacterium]MCW8998967.1 hypothetical protein [Kangiellaceae bacterium]MCW9017148.1 hypothetical protein [Kangiellaceae bacterium]
MFKFTQIVLVVSLVGLSFFSSLGSAKSKDKEFNEVRQQMEINRKKLIKKEITLDESQTKTFWGLYKEYRKAMTKVDDDALIVTERYAKLHNSNTVTNEKAASLMNQYLELEERRLKVKKNFIKKFSKALPAKTVWRFFHLEENINTQIKNAYIDQIPLVE